MSADVGNGWDHIVDPLIAEAKRLGATIHQIKEKFGGLRFYYSFNEQVNITDYETKQRQSFRSMVVNAEHASMKTCEECGVPGFTGGDNWIKTLCTLHHISRMN